jgi:hypothetical protein
MIAANPILAHATLAQQGMFIRFASVYCCAIPLVLVIALAGVYFGVRWYANRDAPD